MGFLDDLKGKLEGAAGTAELAQHYPALRDALMEHLGNDANGGLAGLLEKFKGQGLGEIASSWVSSGANLPVTADQVESTLGPKFIQLVADRTGIPTDKVSAGLAFVLPMVVDKLTHGGNLPDDSNLKKGLDALKNLKF